MTEKEIKRYEEGVKNGSIEKKSYFLDGKEITFRQVNMMNNDNIKTIYISKNKKGNKSLYIISK